MNEPLFDVMCLSTALASVALHMVLLAAWLLNCSLNCVNFVFIMPGISSSLKHPQILLKSAVIDVFVTNRGPLAMPEILCPHLLLSYCYLPQVLV